MLASMRPDSYIFISPGLDLCLDYLWPRFRPCGMIQHANLNPRPTAYAAGVSARPDIIPGLGVDVPELQQARGLWQANRFDEALELFEKAVRKYPQNLVALVDASRALGARFEISRAEAIVDRLAKVAAHNPQLMHLAGQ